MEELPQMIKQRYRRYWIQFAFRLGVLAAVLWIAFRYPEELEMLEGMTFFRHFSVLHLLWGLWVWYILKKFLPLKERMPRGCRKYRRQEFIPTDAYRLWKEQPENTEEHEEFLRQYRKERRANDVGAAWVFAAWIAAALAMYLLQKHQILGTREFLIGSALFYVGDLVCLLIWCPFRDIFMKTRCCTQCRIYNWDVLMLIVPILFVRGFFSYSLLLPALAVVGTWEWNYRRHPERFLPSSNACLQCRNCQGEIGCVRLRLFGKKF